MSHIVSDDNAISVKILDRNYNVKCPVHEQQQLQQAASFLENQMQIVRQSGTITTIESIAVVTALNLAHELMQLKKQKSEYVDEVRQRVRGLQNKIENFLATEEEVTV